MTGIEMIAMANAALLIIDKVSAALAARKENKEMTPEEEAAYDAWVQEQMQKPHWKRSKPKTSSK